VARKQQPAAFEFATGSIRGGSITLVGARRVIVAERRGGCWRVGRQTRKEYNEGYLTVHDGRCYSAAEVKLIRAHVLKR
jgi:hypothetical protein